MVKLCFYVPETHVESVKQAVFATGAGRIGDYDQCAWQILGSGQFHALEGSDPHIGERGEITKVAEYRVEMVCVDDCLAAAIAALKQAHPYEEPAYDAVAMMELD